MSEAANTANPSKDYPRRKLKAEYDMNEGIVALFEDFMLRNEYEEALDVICDCYNIAPTSFVISEIIFKIMMTCDFRLCYKALDYLEQCLKRMPCDDAHKNIFIEGLKDNTGSFTDVWGAFNHFVLSGLHNRKISDGYVSLKEYVKYPNCDCLVQIYVHAFIRGPFKSLVFGSHPEEKFSSLTKWINVYYKYNAVLDELLKHLHSLLDHIFELELSNNLEIPKCAAIHKAPTSKYIPILLNSCKDVFRLENQQRFFIFMDSPYLTLKICKHRLDDMLEIEPVPQSSVLTLKSIVENYFFDKPKEKTPKKELVNENKSPKKPGKGRKSRTPSKDPMSANLKPGSKYKGDTPFHLCCRSNRFDNLLEALYSNKNRDINAKNSLGITPLHEACLTGSYLCCKFLIEEAGVRKVDFRAVDNEGRTPLHFAVHKKALDVVKLLLNRGGYGLIRCQDNMGKKPIDYCESEEIRKILQDAEVQLGPSDDESQNSSDSVQQKLPTLKNPENLPLYLRTLRSLIGTYCEIYDIPKNEYDGEVKMLSHSDEECSHYKASAKGTLCMEDASTFSAFIEDVKKLTVCVKGISSDSHIEKELRGLNILAASLV